MLTFTVFDKFGWIAVAILAAFLPFMVVTGMHKAMIPSKGELYALIDGTIEMIFETKYSLAMKSEDGTEILFHVGLDTVNLKGKYFNPEVSVGKSVKQGDLLLSFDLDKIIEEGFDPITGVIVTNRPDAKIETSESRKVN